MHLNGITGLCCLDGFCQRIEFWFLPGGFERDLESAGVRVTWASVGHSFIIARLHKRSSIDFFQTAHYPAFLPMGEPVVFTAMASEAGTDIVHANDEKSEL
jgi:hypothetical protein